MPYQQLKGSDPLARAFEVRRASAGARRSSPSAPSISMTAVLLVFQLGQPRIFFSMSRDGLLPPGSARVHPRFRTPHVTHHLHRRSWWRWARRILDDDETYDLTNIGTLFAFFVVCLGVLALRIKDPHRPRPFRVPFVWLVAPARGALPASYVMLGLPTTAWDRFGVWMALGVAIYFFYGYPPQPAAERHRRRGQVLN